MTRIVLNWDLSKEFKYKWEGCIEPFMVKGWETWCERVGKSHIHPERNKYKINFPIEWFTVINDEDNYTEDI